MKSIGEWETFARSLMPVSNDMTPLALRNHIKEILGFIVQDMARGQSNAEQVEKSHGNAPTEKNARPSAAETHAALRLAGGFNLDQMVSEYRALRASIIKLWKLTKKEFNGEDLDELIRFNETIDQELTESISHYSKKLSGSKDMFLGILSHDLRNPLGAILGAAHLSPMIGPLNERQAVLNAQIIDSGGRINEIITQLLDVTRARFGSGLPVVAAPMDIGFVARQLVAEMQVLHPDRRFVLEIEGKTTGEWDKARIGQVFSNLLGNSVQYSFKDTPIIVTLNGVSDDVVLSVQNQGVPISSDKIGRIFESLMRGTGEGAEQNNAHTTNLGLGLYITREIITAHGGKLNVQSSEQEGTTFIAHLPRTAKTTAGPDQEDDERRRPPPTCGELKTPDPLY